jgi:hypothetical protein
MTSANLKAALEDARQQLANAVAELHKWNFEVYRLQGLVRTLAANVHDAEKAEAMQQWIQYQMTITDAVESMVNNSTTTLAPSDVKDSLLFYGYDINRYANPAAMVHQTLKRLAEAGRIKEFRGRYMRNDLNQWVMSGTGKLSDMR